MSSDSTTEINQYYDRITLYDFIDEMLHRLERLDVSHNNSYKRLVKLLKSEQSKIIKENTTTISMLKL